MKIDCVLFSIKDCYVCTALETKIRTILSRESNTFLSDRLNFWSVQPETRPPNPAILQVRPRVVPTLLAFKNNIAVLGWEGFATMESHEIKDRVVFDVLNQAANLCSGEEETGAGTVKVCDYSGN
jgi:hypothetical protein